MRAVPARIEHLESLVDCHLTALSHEYVPSLGRRFVRLHDRFYIDQPDGIVLVTLDEASGRVSGFILGGSPAVRPRFVRRNALFVIATIAIRSVMNPNVRKHTLGIVSDGVKLWVRKIRQLGPLPGAIPEEPPGTWGTSIVLGTHPDFRTGGAGKAVALLEGIHAECGRLGFKVTRAMTATTNTASHLLHTRLGWHVIGTAQGLIHYRREVEPQSERSEARAASRSRDVAVEPQTSPKERRD